MERKPLKTRIIDEKTLSPTGLLCAECGSWIIHKGTQMVCKNKKCINSGEVK